ncbi:MAG: hypothetical protein ACP5O1_06540 [Phycisphaerae bacterium]
MTPPVANARELRLLPCPIRGCGQYLIPEGELFRCSKHKLSYRILDFAPPPEAGEKADNLTDHYAPCTQHPDRPSTAICRGSGNYICPACTVMIDGEPWSSAYLQTPAGQQLLKAKYISVLPRPDRNIPVLFICLILFPLTLIMLITSIIWVPYLAVQLVAMIRLRRRSWIYRALAPRSLLIAITVGMGVWMVLGIIAYRIILLSRGSIQ